MRIALAGSHGLIGSALVEHLAGRGHRVDRLVRGAATTSREISWDPAAGRLDPAALAGVDAVVNLGGAGIGDHRWTDAYRRTILRSRTEPTDLLARTLATMDDGPRVLLQASAVGYYGDRGTEVLTEASGPGSGFLVDVVRAWEGATAPAEEAGVRVAHLRTGILVSRTGGSFGRLLPLLRLGVGGPLGDGRNVWSWITLVDQLRAIEHLLTAQVHGAVNLTAPAPAPQREIVAAIARELHRPAVLAVPRFALRLAVGPFADDILSSQHALPQALLDSGFEHRHTTVADAARWVTERTA
ncbi:TIGR01777 family oxidoreductase [Actinotalea sp.]|uniref:TIGR01777 family oxidoreductase n=1 Tax=Actinotalea sp. TaxID=1872145 RepID=UPI002C7B1247|nr:TIGR01777 family oxidoreductase [Actinotalea sp.]HRA50525.1 TIGR01777 family oxidoreductase [Actinotalea sp.]